MKITFLCPHLRIAGGVRAILTYADRLAGRGHDVTVVVLAKRPWRAGWRNLRHRGPDWIPGFRARVRWVSAWDPARLPDADALVATAWPRAASRSAYVRIARTPPAIRRCGQRKVIYKWPSRPGPSGGRRRGRAGS